MKRSLLPFILILAFCSGLRAQLAITGQQPGCNGLCNGSVQITGQGIHAYRYLWNTGDTLPGLTNLCAGTYQCFISDTTGTGLDTLSITLQQPASMVLDTVMVKNVACHGDSTGYVLFHAAGGTGSRYSFNWSNGYTGYLSDSTFFNLPANNYALTITDVNGCTASVAFAVMQPAAIVITSQIYNTTACNTCNGAIAINATGGSSGPFGYLWSTGETSTGISNLCTGRYSLTTTDSSGCAVITKMNVLPAQSNLSVSFSTVTNIDCHHPTGFLFASVSGNNGPVHYRWNTGSALPDIFNIQEGIYDVSVTDSSGCFAVANDTIINLGIVITTQQQHDFICDINQGQIKVSISHGNPPYSLHWSNGATTTTLNGLTPGTYTLTVTDNANCTAIKSYNISQQNSNVFLQTTGIDVSCTNTSNGMAYVKLRGGLAPYSYLWNTSPAQTSDTAVGLPVGNYQVQVTDSFGCQLSGTVTIDSNYSQVSTTTTTANCDSLGSGTAIISAGIPPYSYLWNSQPVQTGSTADSLAIGSYIVSVTDSLGCVRRGFANIHYSCTGYVTGSVFYDANANCHMDGGENGVAGITVLATNNNVTFSGLTNLTGQYSIPVTATGTYAVITAVNSSSTILQYGSGGCGYLEFCPVNDTVTFINLKDTFANRNFGFVGTPDFDLAIQAGWTATDANRLKEYWILYANQAFIAPYTDSATITFKYDPNLTFQSGIPAPVNNTANHTLTWVVDSLPSPSWQWRNRVRAFFTVSTGIAPGYLLKNSFEIVPVNGDCDTANNSLYTEDLAGTSGTPVSKQVSPAGDITLSDSVLTYTIHFQNTGNDTAHIIKVTDSLSAYLDPRSVVTIASDPLFDQFLISPGAVLNWVFNNASLPDSTHNPAGSAGFLSFKAKLKAGTRPGYTVRNKAAVSFNNQPFMITNTTSSYIAFPLATVDLTDNPVSVQVFPNPFNSTAHILVDGIAGAWDLELVDITGRSVKSIKNVGVNHAEIEREGLSAGVYIYCIYTDHKPVAMGRLIIQ